MNIASERLPLQKLYHWEAARAHEVYLTQPMGDGIVRDYTWAQAVGEARRIANYLKSFGWAPGSHIAILSKNCAHWLMSDYAIWMAGYVSVPLYPTLTADSVRQILDHSEAKAVFIGKLDAWEQMKPGVPAGMPCISYPLSPKNDYPTWDDLVAKTAPLKDSPVRPAEDLATIIYTSGTTGMPKGVMHSFSAFAHAIHMAEDRFTGTVNDRVLSYLPLSHIAERVGFEMGSLHLGFRIFFAESLDTFAADLRRAQPTRFFTVPRLWVKFQQAVFAKIPKKKLDRLFHLPIINRIIKKKILKGMGLDQCLFAAGGAAPMPAPLIEWYRDLGLEIIEVYGMTENCAICHSNVAGKIRPGYVGLPYPGVDCRLAQDGEVQMRSPAMMMGYFKEPEKTRETMTDDGWLKTGDRGELDADGRLRITGRAKEIFKTSKGKYVAPAPIENKLGTHPAIEAVCVAGDGHGQPCALAMLSADVMQKAQSSAEHNALTKSLQEHLNAVNATLDAHEQLDFLVVVKDGWNLENGFLTPTLKIKRNEIEKAYGKLLDTWYAARKSVIWQE